MKIKIFIKSLIICIGFSYPLIAQSSFEINTYQQFLIEHKNMTSQQLLEMYPAGKFQSHADSDINSVLYLDSVKIKYQITDEEFKLLQKHGFVVSERLSKNSFGEGFVDIWKKDLPVFISTDAILHPLHKSYDYILTFTEVEYIIPKIDSLLKKMHNEIPYLENLYKANSDMNKMLRDVDIYLTVPRILLGNDIQPFFSENESTVQYLLNLISNETKTCYPLFADTPREIDFSQFKVRGHYDNSPILAKYFKAMMWLGRTEFYLIPPASIYGNPYPFKDVQRQIIDARLIFEAMKSSNSEYLYNEIENILRFFIGESDNVTIKHMDSLMSLTGITTAVELLDSNVTSKFMDTLKTKSFAFQNILSQILIADPFDLESIKPPSAFLLFGQRFIIDSYITGQVVYDRIWYEGENIPRLLPSILDVLFVLGNDASLQLLEDELKKYKYASNLAALRYLIDNYDPAYWNSSLFNLWLQIIRTMNPPVIRDKLPKFMQTAAWWQEKMNTQLSSWSQLRHDNILYAKQSYTGGAICSYPYGYVEPNPDFYRAVKNYSEMAKLKFSEMFSDHYNPISNYYFKMSNIMDTLISISEKELNNQELSSNEINFLKHLLYAQYICGKQYDGWYPRLYFWEDEQMLESDFTVADVHTVPTDMSGTPIGWVLHAGTGMINIGIWIVKTSANDAIAYAGPVMSYHEYITTNFLRLNDEEWKDSYLKKSTRPAWVNLYLTDTLGYQLPPGINLITTVSNDPVQNKPATLVLNQNYPNPFNSSTIITYTIPPNFSHYHVKLTIYNIYGQRVKKLIDDNLPYGNYITKWDGTDDSGNILPSGTYLCKLEARNWTSARKITLIK